jgi:hypothetical protein
MVVATGGIVPSRCKAHAHLLRFDPIWPGMPSSVRSSASAELLLFYGRLPGWDDAW